VLASLLKSSGRSGFFGNDDEDYHEGIASALSKLSPIQAGEAIAPLLREINESSATPGRVQILGIILKATAARLTHAQSIEAIQSLLETIDETTDPVVLAAFYDGLSGFSIDLTDTQAANEISRSLEFLQSREHEFGGLPALTSKLTESQAVDAVQPLLRAIRQTTDPQTLATLCAGVNELSVQLSDMQAIETIPRFLSAIEHAVDPYSLNGFEKLGAFPVSLAEGSAREILIPQLMAALNDPVVEGPLADALLALLEKLSGSAFHGSVWEATEWIKSEQTFGRLRDLNLDTI
jgi:hypothetical protein